MPITFSKFSCSLHSLACVWSTNKMEACNLNSPQLYFQFSCILVLLSLTASFQNTLIRIKLHETAYSKNHLRVWLCPRPRWGSSRRSQGSLVSWDRIDSHPSTLLTVTSWHRVCSLHLFSAFFTAQCTLVQMRGLGIACRLSVRLSVCPSVTLMICDHIGWKSWKLIARTFSPSPSLFVAKRRFTYSQGNMGVFWGY